MATKKSRTVKKAERDRENQIKREIVGVCFIAFALFVAAGIYTDMVGVIGTAVEHFFFGVFGIAGYAVPVILLGFGVLSIVMSKTENGGSMLLLIFLALTCILVMVHTYTRGSINSTGVISYYKDAYLYGKLYFKGGGLLGALIAYPSALLLGAVGTYIFFGAALLIVFLIATKLSIRAMGEKVGTGIRTGVEAVAEKVHQSRSFPDFDMPVQSRRDGAQGLYTENLAEQERAAALVRKKKAAEPVVRRKPEPAVEKPNYKKNWDGDISFIPANGEIPKKAAKQDDDPFDILAVVDEKNMRTADAQPEPIAPAEQAPVVKVTIEDVREASASITPEPPAYAFPPVDRLKKPVQHAARGVESPLAKGKKLEETLASFNIEAKVINYSVGPTITRFELHPALGVRVNRITSLADDIALALAAPRVRIEAPIPGKSAIGIEIPNKDTVPVLLREVIESADFTEGSSSLRFGLGKDIAGKVVCADLDKMPHLLIAGSTGSGKSVCINDIILSFVYGKKPEDVRLIMVDPKKVELKVYSPLPHLLMPVVTDAKKAAGALKWAVMEMEQRYAKMSKFNARDINRYNSLQTDAAEKLPRLVIIIDELADLMMVAAKEVEDSICRIAQLGRAAGIHLIVATQRPSTDIITGLIKANIPSRIALAVSSAVDSRVIMDVGGAEKLLGRGDMLFHANGANKPVRAQAAFVSDEEVESVMAFFDEQNNGAQPQYKEISLEEVSSVVSAAAAAMGQGNGKQEDELLDDAVKIVLESGQASISMIQRRLRVGYARAARLIDIMEQHGVVSGFDGSKPRKLLVTSFAEYQQLSSGNNEQTEE